MTAERRWIDVTLSEFPHEKAALNFIRSRFSTREPFRAWSNFTFIADDGSMNEVDLLVVSPTGVYLVEIKSYPGRIEGDAGTWRWIEPTDGRTKWFDNPLKLANRKAKKLASLLRRQPAFAGPKGHETGFFLQPVVFLSDPTLRVALDDGGRQHVYGPDSEDPDQPNDLPGIVRLFNAFDVARGRRVDTPLSAAIAKAMEQAGIRESRRLQKAGQYELGELLDEGEGWQEFRAEHPTARGIRRRIRIYQTEAATSSDEREALRRAADREFRILRGIEHPGIERPLELVESSRGPALVFEDRATAPRLDHWLAEHGEELDLMQRIELVQELGEALRAAHRKGVFHRGLSPRSVRVVTNEDGGRRLRIRDWQTATRSATSVTVTSMGTTHVAGHVPEDDQLFLAPELSSVPDSDARAADIWSLGALAILILAGRPPAPDLDGLRALLREQGALSLAAVMDAPPEELVELVRHATSADSTRRYVSVEEFLEYLGLAIDDITRPPARDLLEAQKGDLLDDGSTVLRRIGTGSTSLVLVVEKEGRQEVLKIARSEEHADRLRTEYETLRRLRDRTIIEAYDIENRGGRTVLRLEPALETLAVELQNHGRLSLDRLDRFGGDLLDAVVLLDEEGVAHRDLKPDNLGIVERGKDRERRLALFDFSLAGSDPSALHVGTRGYQDPFLEERKPPRWDGQAERYAAAVTLYEMSTGTRPRWGDGSTDPALTDLQLPVIDEALLDPAVRAELTAFFRRALHRKPDQRFDTAGEMRDAWHRVFRGTEPGQTPVDEGVPVAELDLDQVTETSSLLELPISARVRDALERLGVTTAGSLLAIPSAELVRIAGVGAATRAEVNHLARRLRERGTPAVTVDDGPHASIDRIATQLVPQPPADEDHRTAVATLLGLADTDLPRWPSLRDTATHAKLDPELVAGALMSARARWSRQRVVTDVRHEVLALLAARGGIMGADEVAALLLTTRGTVSSEPERSARARAVVRAALETEAALQSPGFVARRVGERLLIALDGSRAAGESDALWDADALTEAAARLAEAARELVEREPLADRDHVVRTLREVPLPDGLAPFKDARLVRTAAAAAEGVSVSPQLLLYPTGMKAERALAETRGVLLSRRGITVDEVRNRVRARFPDAEPLPDRPALDRLLEVLEYRWDPDNRIYVLPRRGGVFATATTVLGSGTSARPTDELAIAFRELDRRLRTLVESGGFLALSVDPRRLDTAARAVTQAVGGTHLSLDAMLVKRLRALVEEAPGADWAKVLEADARKGERPWTRLLQVLDKALPTVEEALTQTAGVAVLTDVGLLARYGKMDLLERLREQVTRQATDTPLKAVVIVTPSRGAGALPTVDGQPIPVITQNQWARLPSGWLARTSEGDAA